MIVISDSSPLNYLLLIQQVHLLPALFGRVLSPPSVLDELSRTKAPDLVRAWAAATPDWLEIRAPEYPLQEHALGPGEADAIALAAELNADILLIDERDGARFARQRGLIVTGTLGYLKRPPCSI